MLVRRRLLGLRRLEVTLEMLKQGDLLLEFFRKVSKLVLSEHILLFSGRYRFAFVVEKAESFVFGHNFGRIIEKDSCGLV